MSPLTVLFLSVWPTAPARRGADSRAMVPAKSTRPAPSRGVIEPTENFLPAKPTLPKLRAAARSCRGCPLYLNATQTVFGEGSVDASIVLIGEQPGDREDMSGRPFVGPAGQLLDEALQEAGIERGQVYVTNAVKHFNFEPRGKFRLHKRPPASAVNACLPWMRAELGLIEPAVVVLLGATAAQALFGAKFRITRERGKLLKHELAPAVIATLHPSGILRAPDEAARAQSYGYLVADLKLARKSASSVTRS
jgi:uracil-DNA glycosylase